MSGALPGWPWKKSPARTERDAGHLELARESLRELIDDARLPAGIRESLAEDYAAVRNMLEKLEHGHIHLAAVGRVSTGKSSLLNALMGEELFTVSPLHGETRTANLQSWREVEAGGVFLLDTPGLDETDGESREQLALEAANRSDLVLFVVDGDITDTELAALRVLVRSGRPVILVLNKKDLYTASELERLLAVLATRCAGLVDAEHIVAAAAAPRPQIVLATAADGTRRETERTREADVEDLRVLLWDIIEAEGKMLAALNASLFAADLSDQVGRRLLAARREVGERLVRTYCLAKGVTVALNPVPVADLFAAAFIDVGMVVHLSKVYGLPLSRREAGSLVGVIAAETAAIMATVWAIHLGASALKLGTAGLSTVATAAAQGAVAWYSTLIVGRVAGEYLARGKSWGDAGPKKVVKRILDSLDRDSVLRDARREIRSRLQRN